MTAHSQDVFEPGAYPRTYKLSVAGKWMLSALGLVLVSLSLVGAIFFSVGWIIATKLFQLYVARYDRYNPTYLALASIVVLLTWMYLTCLLLLLGGKLNAILRREGERMRAAAPAVPEPAPTS